jgi:hypothetical protein
MKRLGQLDIGNQIKLGGIFGKPIIWTIADKNHKGYPANSITLVTSKIIKLAAFDGKEPENKKGSRSDWGNNNYRQSNIGLWLNSRRGPGGWFQKCHENDTPPTPDAVSCNPYISHAGFLSGFSKKEKAIILGTELLVEIPEIDGGGIERLIDKIFLLSATEVGFRRDEGGEEYALALFSDNSSRIARPTAEAIENSEFRHEHLNAQAPWYWWCRSPSYGSNSYNVRIVHIGGSANYFTAYDGLMGVRPACNLLSNNLVSDEPDSDGVYHIILNNPLDCCSSNMEKSQEIIITIDGVMNDLVSLKNEYLKQGIDFRYRLSMKHKKID